jgi:hypothetical protein
MEMQVTMMMMRVAVMKEMLAAKKDEVQTAENGLTED